MFASLVEISNPFESKEAITADKLLCRNAFKYWQFGKFRVMDIRDSFDDPTQEEQDLQPEQGSSAGSISPHPLLVSPSTLGFGELLRIAIPTWSFAYTSPGGAPTRTISTTMQLPTRQQATLLLLSVARTEYGSTNIHPSFLTSLSRKIIGVMRQTMLLATQYGSYYSSSIEREVFGIRGIPTAEMCSRVRSIAMVSLRHRL